MLMMIYYSKRFELIYGRVVSFYIDLVRTIALIISALTMLNLVDYLEI